MVRVFLSQCADSAVMSQLYRKLSGTLCHVQWDKTFDELKINLFLKFSSYI